MPNKIVNNNLIDANLHSDELVIINDLLSAALNSSDFSNNINLNVQILRGYLDCDLIEIWIPNVEENTISLVSNDFDTEDVEISNYVNKSSLIEYTSKQYIATPVWSSKKIQWLQLNEQKDVLVRQTIALAANISTVIALPVFHNETIASLVYVYYKNKIEYNAQTEELLKICTKQISYQIKQSHIHHLVNEFLSNSNDVICITNFSGKIQTVTKAFCETFKISQSEIKGVCFGKFRDTDKIIDDAFIAKNTKDPKQNFDITYTVNNNKITIAWNATFVEKEKLIIFSGKDITQKIEIANELIHKNEQLENINNELNSILKNANEAIFKLDTNGIFTEVSDSVKEILGYEPKELVGKSFSTIVHIDDLEEIYKLIITNINNTNIVKKFSHRAKKKNGKWTWLNTSGQTVFNKNNAPQYIIGLSVDITETHEDKLQSKQLLDQFINIFNYNPFPVIIYNQYADKILEINEAACVKYGYSKTDFLQLKKSHFFEELENNTNTEFKNKNNTTFYNFDNKNITKQTKKDGSVFYANINCREILFKNEICTICTVKDITKELHLNEELKNSTQRYKLYIENSKDSIYRYETKNPVPLNLPLDILVKRIGEDFYLAETNNVFVKRYGLNSVEEIKGLSLKEISEIQKLDIKHTIGEFLKNKYDLTNFEFSTIDANGKTNYFTSSVNGFVENGNLVRIWGTSKNITETKLAQIQLEQSEYRYKYFIENSNDSITRYEFKEPIDLNQDIETLIKLVYSTGYLAECNNMLPNRLGIKKEELYGMNLGKLITSQKLDFDRLFVHFLENNCVVIDFENKIIDPLGNVHYISISSNGHIVNNKLVRIWSTAKDITKEKTEEIQTQFLANILNQINDAIYTADENFKITSWNKGAVTIFGTSEKEAIGKKIADFLNPNYSNGGIEKVIKELQQKGNWMGEVYFTNPLTNKQTTFLSTITLFEDKEKIVKQYIVTSKDISEKKLAQIQLEQSEYRYKYFIENSNNSITRYDFKEPIDLNQDIETLKNLLITTSYLAECNNVLPNRLGIKKEELYGISLEKLIYLQKIDIEPLFLYFLENNCIVNDFENKLVDPFGKTHYISISINGQIENNKLVRIWSTSKDITKEKTEELKNQFFGNILNQINDSIYTVDENLKITSWNKGSVTIFGIPEKEAIGKKIADFLNPDYSNGGRENAIKEVQQKGNWMGEVYFTNPLTNKQTTLLSTISLFENKEKNVKQYIVTSKDISEKKLVDSKIIESENRFINIANHAPVMLWQTGANGEKFFYNKKLSEFTGLSKEQLVIIPWMSLVHPDDLQSIYNYVLVQLEKREPFEIEYRFKHHSGIYKWILDKAVPRFLPNGDFDGYIGICIDIDENKKTFEKIQESEIRFRNMADQAPVMIWLTDENDNTIYYSQGWLNFTGKSLKEELNISWDEKIVEEDRKKTVAEYYKALDAQKPFVLEYRLKTKKNETRWVLDKGTPRFLSNGQFAGYIGVCIDIQDLKETELELKEANERYEIINEATSEAIWEFNLYNNKGKWGKGYKKLFGYDETEVESTFWSTKVHPEDWEFVKKIFVDYDINEIRKNNILKAEYRFLKADNTYAYIREVAYIAFDENGNPHKMIGSQKDISQQKNLELKLIQNEIDKQIAINKAMIEGQEKEKLELSQELHDNINQLISSAKLYMEVAKRNTNQNEMIDKSIETLSEAILEMRKLSKSLNPITLNKLTIVDAIEQLVYDIEQTGKLTIEFDCINFNYNITLPQLNLYLYRIVQEQINNIIKYAKTNEATIKLENNYQFLYLTISDNGIGFDKSQKRNGIGITNIVNRVNLFKGDIDIKTSPNNGCSIEIRIPLNIEYF